MPSPESKEIRKTLVKDSLESINTPIVQKRKEWDDYAKSIAIPKGITVTEESIEGIFCLWLRSQTPLDDYVLVYMHGGGLTEGSVFTAREWTARITKQTQIPVLSVDYRLAPENPYPAALEDMLSIYKHLLSIGYNSNKIFFAADSTGCNLALSTLIELRDAGEFLPAATIFISPSVDLTSSGESLETRFAVEPLVTVEAIALCAKQYAQEIELSSPCVSPLFADLSNLPNTLIQVGDHEILLSDSIRLHEAILKVGGKAKLDIWEDMWHVWHYFPDLPEAQKALEDISKFLNPFLL